MGAKHRQAALEIGLFLREPSGQRLPLIVDLAKDLKGIFLDGGLIKDCLSIVGSLDQKQLKELAAMSAERESF